MITPTHSPHRCTTGERIARAVALLCAIAALGTSTAHARGVPHPHAPPINALPPSPPPIRTGNQSCCPIWPIPCSLMCKGG